MVWVFVDSGFFVLAFVSVERTEEPVPLLEEVLGPDAELLPVLADTVLVPLEELLEEDDSVLPALLLPDGELEAELPPLTEVDVELDEPDPRVLPDAELLPVLADTVLVPLDELLEEDDSVLEADLFVSAVTALRS